MKNKNIIISLVLLILLIASRLIPHISNFTPLFAIGLFSFSIFKKQYLSLIIPLIGLLFTDLIIGFYQNVWAVYLSVILSIILSNLIKTKKKNVTIVLRSISAPTIFFLLSNLSVFFLWYPNTFEGLIQCYFNAIPFYGYSLLSTLIYSFVFYNLYTLIFNQELSFNN